MSRKKKDPVDVYRPQRDAAAQNAAGVSPFTKEVEEYTNTLWKMYTGKEKFDLSKMPNANAILPLYEAAKARSDRGRRGRGLAYGGGSGSGGSGYNPNLIAAIDEQNQSERERDAAGALEQRVADTFAGIGGRMAALGEGEYDRRSRNFDRYNSIFMTEAQLKAQRDSKPKWWESALSGGLGALGSWAQGGFMI